MSALPPLNARLQSVNNITLFILCATTGDLAGVQYMVERCSVDVCVHEHYALLESVRNGHLPVVQYLIKNGANFSEIDLMGISAERGHLQIVRYLVEQHGSNMHTDDEYALRISARYGHLPIVQYLVEHGADVHTDEDYTLRQSAAQGHLPVVQYLVEHGADVHAHVDSALRYSAYNGHLPVVQYLVQAGADIHARNDEALIASASRNYLPVVQYLVEHGANVRIQYGVLHASAHKGYLPIVQYLVEHGADVHAMDNIALRAALHHTHRTVARYLLRIAFSSYCALLRIPRIGPIDQHSVAVHVQNTYLHYAALSGTMRKSMNRRVAMDVQHLVIEMLLGTSVMVYFRSARSRW